MQELHTRGCRIRALVKYNSTNHCGWLEGVPGLSDIDVAAGDIRDPYFCDQLMEGVDVVFNLAALIGIPYSYVAPHSYLEVNVGGTLNLCQAALKHDVQRFVQVSTSEVYGTARSVPIAETHPLQPQSPYRASKIGADSMAIRQAVADNETGPLFDIECLCPACGFRNVVMLPLTTEFFPSGAPPKR